MRQSTITTAVVLSLFALTSVSFAGNHNNKKKGLNVLRMLENGANPSQMLGQSLFAGRTKHSNSNPYHATPGGHNKQDDNINNILPVGAPGSGGAPVDPVPTSPPSRPGFVWVGDHWERARSTSSPMTLGPPPVANGGGGVTVTPANSGPVIRDHRTGVAGGGQTVTSNQVITPPPVVLNPPITQPKPARGSGGRPHFNQTGASGGITVSVVPGSQRTNDVTGVGGSPIDAAIDSVIGIFQGGGITPAGSRDHRR